MSREQLPLDLTSRLTPRALAKYASALGWTHVEGINGDLAVYHRPDSRLHQVLIPLDDGLGDYAEMTAEAVRKLAAYEKRPARDVLDHLLLPPADVMEFREISPQSEVGTLPFERAVQLMTGTRDLLLSAAHSVLVPQTYHPRLSRSEGRAFLSRCRFGQTKPGSFVFQIACPLDLTPVLPGLEPEPYARRVTSLLMDSLSTLAQTVGSEQAGALLDLSRNPGLSANFCEALLQLRPEGDRASLTISAVWSRALLPASREPARRLRIPQEVFDLAEKLAPQLRTRPGPRPARFIGFVDVLRGQPTRGDSRPSGEVDFTIFDDEQGEIHARGVLGHGDYAVAGAAHLASDVIAFKGILRRLPRVSRIDGITDFERVQFEETHSEPDVPRPGGAAAIPF